MCNCVGCHNTSENESLRQLIRDEAQQKNPLAFKSKYKNIDTKDKKIHSRGCNCTKTGCVKNYCECFKEGLGCSRFCKCVECKNDQIELADQDVALYYDKVKRKRKRNSYLYEFYFEKIKKLTTK